MIRAMSGYCGFDRAWEIVCANEARLAAFGPDGVAGILRGGAYVAVMAAHALKLPVWFLEMVEGRPAWHSASPPPAGSRLVLADDIVSSGRTLSQARSFLEAQGYETLAFTLFHDAAVRTAPEVSIPAEGYVQFPWEFRDRSPGSLEARSRGLSSHAAEEDYFGVDLDGVLLDDLPRRQYRRAERLGGIEKLVAARGRLPMKEAADLPPVNWKRAIIVTGRPESDLEATRAWLASRGLESVPVLARPPGLPPEASAAHKAQAIHDFGITHFFESDLLQAIEIAAAAPACAVYWWGRTPRRRLRLFAHPIAREAQ